MILIVLQALAIGRSWELIGARRTSLFALIGGLDEPEDEERRIPRGTAGKEQ